jgi:hypothetical protein
MPDLPWLAVLVGTVLAFVLGAGYYAVLGNQLAAARDGAPAVPAAPVSFWFVPVELMRCLLLAGVVIGLAAATDTTTWWGGLALGLALWVGFPLVLWIGAVVHERAPVRLAVIHGGDWLLKLLAIGTLAGMWT